MTDKMWRGLGAAFKAPIALWVGVGGVWKSVTGVWVGKSGAWQKEFPGVVPGPLVPDSAVSETMNLYGFWGSGWTSVMPTSGSVKADFTTPVTITEYTLDYHGSASPTAGGLEGSNDDITYTPLDSFTGGADPAVRTVASPGSFRYYRFFLYGPSYPPGWWVTITAWGTDP